MGKLADFAETSPWRAGGVTADVPSAPEEQGLSFPLKTGCRPEVAMSERRNRALSRPSEARMKCREAATQEPSRWHDFRATGKGAATTGDLSSDVLGASALARHHQARIAPDSCDAASAVADLATVASCRRDDGARGRTWRRRHGRIPERRTTDEWPRRAAHRQFGRSVLHRLPRPCTPPRPDRAWLP